MSNNRRSFLKNTSLAAAGTFAATLPTASARAAGANERVRVGFIGPGGRGFGAHVKSLSKLAKDGENVELASVAEVYSVQRDKVADYIQKENGSAPSKYVDYRDMIEEEQLDAVSIGTPDHWHHKQTVDSLKAGKHVYCEKPMTKTVEEALSVVDAWEKSGKVMQVGVQGTSQPMWNAAREKLESGLIGKVLMFQTEYFRNSYWGQWRNYKLEKEMTPKSIDWDRWLGVKEGLAETQPFDREVYKQWRRFWPFGSGMFTDLFVHRVTMMLKATGLRWPGRVVGAGGIYLEYDGRDVPDVATIAADYPEGVQGVVSTTMCNEETRIDKVIRGHNGSLVFDTSNDSFEFIPERIQVTKNRDLKPETFTVKPDSPYYGDRNWQNLEHFRNWIKAIQAGDPQMCHNPPDLGAAAVTTVILGAQSYRNGVVYYFDPKDGPIDGQTAHAQGRNWAKIWEEKSKQRDKPNHIAGWKAGDTGSTLDEPSWMALAGPWVDGQPPS